MPDRSPPRPALPPVASVKLVLFPGELKDPNGATQGFVYCYVGGKLMDSYEACCGPPPGHDRRDGGGHTASATPTGEYTLGAPEHHTSTGWPASVVPWGAQLRQRNDGEIEYSTDGRTWRVATGPDGAVTRSLVTFIERSREDQAESESKET